MHHETLFSKLIKRPYWIPYLIVIFIGLGYWHTLSFPLIFDDYSTLIENMSIRDLHHLKDIILAPHEIGLAWRPWANFTFALSYAISGLNPWGHHLFNILLHCLTAYILFQTLYLTFSFSAIKRHFEEDGVYISLAITLLWAVNPIQTQTVTYISQRTETLMTLMFLTTIYCFIRAQEKKSVLWFSASIISCILGAMSKEVIVTAPVIIFLYDRTFITSSFKQALKSHWLYYLGLCLSWPVLAILLSTMKNQAVGFDMGVNPYIYALTSCKALITYLRLSYFPYPLIFDRGPLFIYNLEEALPYALPLLVILCVSVYCVIKKPVLGFLLASFFIILSPTSSFVPVATVPIAENRLYLPLVITLTLGVLGLRFIVRKSYTWITLILITVSLVGTYYRNQVYASAITVWKDSVEKIPENSRAHNNLGYLLYNTTDRIAEARKEIEEAIHYDPNYSDAYNNLGLILAMNPSTQDDIIKAYQNSVRLNPNNAEAHTNLGNMLGKDPNHIDEAKKHLEIALSIKPYSAEFHNDYAILLATNPATQTDAIKHYEEAIRLKPTYEEAHNNLANLLTLIKGQEKETLKHYQIAIQINPKSGAAHYNYALFLKSHAELFTGTTGLELAATEFSQAIALGIWTQPSDIALQELNIANLLCSIPSRKDDAVAHYKRALEFSNTLAIAHLNYAEFLSQQSTFQASDVNYHYITALKLSPESPLFHISYAKYLETKTTHTQEAIEEYTKAISLDPTLLAAHEGLGRIYSLNTKTFTQAIHHYREAIKLDPKSVYNHVSLATLCSHFSNLSKEAEINLKEAIRLEPRNPEIYNAYGSVLSTLGTRNKDAITAYHEAINLKPDYALAHNNLANLLATIPDHQSEAITEYFEALKSLPNSYAIHYNLALLLEKDSSKKHAALEHYTLCLKLNPEFAPAKEALKRLSQNP